jgi:hypothetical protein
VRVSEPMSKVSSNRQKDRSGMVDALVRDLLAVHPQHAAAALGHTGAVVLEVKFKSMLASAAAHS